MELIYRHRVRIAALLLLLIATGAAALLLGWRPTFLPFNAQEVVPPASNPVAPESASAVTPTALATIKVYVAGAVVKPGVYELDATARVEDAVRSAGGPAADSAMEQINLAARLHDEEQITVPRKGDPTAPPPDPSAANPPASAKAQPTGPVDINTADAATLETLPEIGPVLAARIVTYREQHGLFATVEDLVNVPGIGPKLFDAVKPFVVVGSH